MFGGQKSPLKLFISELEIHKQQTKVVIFFLFGKRLILQGDHDNHNKKRKEKNLHDNQATRPDNFTRTNETK